jgi:hypothetical protein
MPGEMKGSAHDDHQIFNCVKINKIKGLAKVA